MPLSRLSLRWLLTLVAVAALNFALARHFLAYDAAFALELMPSLVLCQAAIVLACVSARPGQAFWISFGLASLLIGLSRYIAEHYSTSLGVAFVHETNSEVLYTFPGRFGGDTFASLWQRYRKLALATVPPPFQTKAAHAAFATLPPLLAGSIAGCFASVLSRLTRRRKPNSPRPLNPPPCSPASPP